MQVIQAVLLARFSGVYVACRPHPLTRRIIIMSMPIHNVRMGRDGGDSRGIHMVNTSVAVVVLHQSVSGSYVAEESNCGKR